MRPLLRALSPVIPIGFLITVVVMIEGLQCEGPHEERQLRPAELDTIRSNHEVWLKSNKKPGHGERANLCKADLQRAHLKGADLSYSNLQGADLRWANLEGAKLEWANLQKAALWCANLQKANLFEAELQGANLWNAQLQRVYLDRANVHKADFGGANLQEVLYEPKPDDLPSYWTLGAPINHSDTLVFYYSPAALMALREAFKRGECAPRSANSPTPSNTPTSAGPGTPRVSQTNIQHC